MFECLLRNIDPKNGKHTTNTRYVEIGRGGGIFQHALIESWGGGGIPNKEIDMVIDMYI